MGTSVVIGARDRDTSQGVAEVIPATNKALLQGFVADHVAEGATVYTDEHRGHEGIPFTHETVRHALARYGNGDGHTTGIESLWSMMKRAHHGPFHKMSPRHLDRYVRDFAAHHTCGRRTPSPSCLRLPGAAPNTAFGLAN